MTLNTANAVNGEIKRGDWVISTPDDEYGCLIGQVVEITKLGTPEHAAEADNSTDNVHVDFTAFDYPHDRITEIEEVFSDLYGEPKKFDDLPIDDTIMAPDVLIRITELGHDEITRIGNSLEECEAFCARFKHPESAYSLDAMKKVLGDDYGFHQSKTVEEVKRILETGEMPDENNVPFVLEAGNLDIEITIRYGMGVITQNGAEPEPMSIGYFCCVRENGEWASHDNIDENVNLDAPDIESEMFRVLVKYAEEQSLSFFASNERTPQVNEAESESEDEYELEM
jgi:hypothetical protein